MLAEKQYREVKYSSPANAIQNDQRISYFLYAYVFVCCVNWSLNSQNRTGVLSPRQIWMINKNIYISFSWHSDRQGISENATHNQLRFKMIMLRQSKLKSFAMLRVQALECEQWWHQNAIKANMNLLFILRDIGKFLLWNDCMQYESHNKY